MLRPQRSTHVARRTGLSGTALSQRRAGSQRLAQKSRRPPDYQTSNTKYHYLANQQATDGDYGLYRVDIAPAGGGPGPHFHRAMSEAFFVLSGAMKLYDGNDWRDGHQGDFLYVPPGGIHGFRNDADEPASILMLFAPGAPREAYFEGLAELGDLTDEQRREWFIRHDNFWVAPTTESSRI